jgi:cobalt-zinc-cadmium efflux system outer membrane protein
MQEFVTAGKLGLSREVAAREVLTAERRSEQARLQVMTTARSSFFEALAAQRALQLTQQLSDIAQQAVRVSEQRLQAQDIPRTTLLQSQIESERTALLQQQATQQFEAAWRRLSTVTGLENSKPRPLADELQRPLPNLEWESSRERILSESPELAAMRFAVERARWAVERATAGRVPNVNVQAGAGHDDASNDAFANVQVSMPLPVFDRNQGAIAQACGQLAAAQAALRQQELIIEQRLASALRDYNTARHRVDRYTESILPAARESLDLARAGYEQGESDYLQVLSVQQTYAEASLAYLQELETAWKRWAEMDALLVGSLPGDLTESTATRTMD